ncbi:formate dehydrogenase subunit delta [Chelatococcus sambhunathii]|uniref:Formate dehydrogenase subunit delta n=1 Tax=Chelatococcus sambhunathii TaxID=363953 RepID=A0ABU1DEJ8_9HYPH|nr:formate dehydrogenase subunit delta [Chelatococcus sambhunathii]MDR4306543.1 formate dehydrogenase subunit delta [Chelatococcus sambhunathii]
MSHQPGAAGMAEALHDEEHSHKSTLDRLIYMANQIGWFFKSQPEEKRVPGVLDHIQHFWDPRMRSEIFRHIDATGGTGIEPYPLEALMQLKLATENKLRTQGEAEKVETGQQRTGEAPKDVTEEGRG